VHYTLIIPTPKPVFIYAKGIYASYATFPQTVPSRGKGYLGSIKKRTEDNGKDNMTPKIK
jgi:hypothetical protein